MLPTIKIRIERWKFNKNYGVWVSTHGRFKNRDKADLPYRINDNGYVVIKVECTSCRYELAHRLVMMTWRPTTEAKRLTVDHKNHNKRDNSLENLEWVTYQENQRRAKADQLSTAIKKDFLNTIVWIDDQPMTNQQFIEMIKKERPGARQIEIMVRKVKDAPRKKGANYSTLYGHKYQTKEDRE